MTPAKGESDRHTGDPATTANVELHSQPRKTQRRSLRLDRRTRYNIYLSLFSIAFTLLIIEAIGRYFTWRHSLLASYPPLPVISRLEPNIDGEWTLVGDLNPPFGRSEAVEPHRIHFTTDAYGFRNEVSDPENISLLILSDSYGAGPNSNPDHWGEQMAAKLGVTAYNLSVPATGPWQEYVTFVSEYPRLQVAPDGRLVWMLFAGNDLNDTYHSEWDIEKLQWLNPQEQMLVRVSTFWKRSFLGGLMTTLSRPRGEYEQTVTPVDIGVPLLLFNQYAAEPDDVRAEPNYPLLLRTIQEMQAFTDEHGLDLTIVLAPSKEQIFHWAIDGAAPWSGSGEPGVLASALRSDGVCFLDLRPGLAAESKRLFEQNGEVLWWRDDTHWNVAGNRVAADLIADAIQTGAACP